MFGVKNPYLKASRLGMADWSNWITIVFKLHVWSLSKAFDGSRNGLGAQDVLEANGEIHDSYRIDYLRDHIQAMHDAVSLDGVELWGFTPWGCIDLVSASTGEMHKRYGFVYVDYQDDGTGNGNRIRKDSFYWYKRSLPAMGKI